MPAPPSRNGASRQAPFLRQAETSASPPQQSARGACCKRAGRDRWSQAHSSSVIKARPSLSLPPQASWSAALRWPRGLERRLEPRPCRRGCRPGGRAPARREVGAPSTDGPPGVDRKGGVTESAHVHRPLSFFRASYSTGPMFTRVPIIPSPNPLSAPQGKHERRRSHLRCLDHSQPLEAIRPQSVGTLPPAT